MLSVQTVEPRIEKSQRWLPSPKLHVVEQRYDARQCWSCCRCSIHHADRSIDEHWELVSRSCNIRRSPSRKCMICEGACAIAVVAAWSRKIVIFHEPTEVMHLHIAFHLLSLVLWNPSVHTPVSGACYRAPLSCCCYHRPALFANT